MAWLVKGALARGQAERVYFGEMDGFGLTTHMALLAVLWEDVGGVTAKLVSS